MTPPASTLRGMQDLFWHSVRHDRTNDAMRAAVAPCGALSADARVDIYRKMYWYRQVDALYDGFPALAGSIGEERFTRLACRYLAARPSTSALLEHLGEGLAAFMREEPEDLVPGMRTLWAEVALLEWTQTRALLAPDPRRAVALAELPFDRLATTKLELAPSVKTCAVSPAAFEIVRRASARTATRLDVGATHAGDRAGSRTVLVWRPGFAVRERILASDEEVALSRIAGGATLGAVVLAFEGAADPAERAAECVARWIGDELVCGLTFGEVGGG